MSGAVRRTDEQIRKVRGVNSQWSRVVYAVVPTRIGCSSVSPVRIRLLTALRVEVFACCLLVACWLFVGNVMLMLPARLGGGGWILHLESLG